MIRAFFDGLCEPENPGGVSCYSFVIYRKLLSGDEKIFEDSGVAAEPGPDSNQDMAEYTGLIKALEWMLDNLNDRELEIRGDSKHVLEHLTGKYSVSSPQLRLHNGKVRTLLQNFSWTAEWIPGIENVVADELTVKAYNEYCMQNYGNILPRMRQGAIK